jgi:hypothetical protein
MRYKKFLIIFALFFIFIGNTESKINVGIISAVKNKAKQLKEKKYDVSYSNDKVIAPGASIIYKGQVYQNEATVPSDALVGIYKDSKYYLYSPSIGKDTLTEINSRRSFGYFLLNRSTQTLQVKTKKAILPKAISYPTTLDTGISVNSTDAINFTFENPLKRWAALKNRTQATKSIFLQPRGPFLELNFVQALEGGDLIDSFACGSTTTVVAKGDIVETYGSIVKLIPSLSMIKLLKPQLFSSIQNALVKDPDLYIRLNAVEYITTQIEAIEQIAGILIPSKCFGMIVNSAFEVFKAAGAELLINGDDEAVRKSFGQSLVNDTAFIEFPTCVAELACAGVTAGACALVTASINEVIDIGGLLYWIADDSIIGSFDEYTHNAYAEWTLPNNAPIITSLTANPTTVSTGAVSTITCNASDPDGDTLSYNWSATGGVLSSTTTNPVTWTAPNTPGTYTINVTVTDGYGGSVQGSTSVVVSLGLNNELGEAVDNTNLTWTTGGNSNWFNQTLVSYYGGDAAQSGDISDNQQTYLQTNIAGPGTLSFYWKVSSEANYDYLRFYIDDVEQSGRISGSVDWTQKSFTIPSGNHTIKWAYTKDGSESSGSDCGWIDKVEFSTSIPPILSWTGETNYVSDGLNPENDYSSALFVYRVKYMDLNNDPPATGYPKVHILKGGAEISGSPFSMSYVSGSYNTGAIYSYSTTLQPGTDYTYYFEAKDTTNLLATGSPTSSIDAPDVISSIPSGTFRTGKEYSGYSGDFSSYSDVYPDDGVRISPWSGDGVAWYDFALTNFPSSISITFTWTDNAWFQGEKQVWVYNWFTNQYDVVYSWNTYDGIEHITTVNVSGSSYVRTGDGLFRVAFYGSSDSVIHLKNVSISY